MDRTFQEFVERHQEILVAVGLFFAILLFVGFAGRILLHRVIYAWDPAAKRQTLSRQQPGTRLMLAGAGLLAWLFAFTVASEVTGLHWMRAVVSVMGSMLPGAGAAIVIALLVAYSFSRQGNDLMLSVIGYFFLKKKTGSGEKRVEIDLGEGETGTVEKVDLLHTTFKTSSGRSVTKPNAFLMRKQYGWAQPR